jgi:mannose-6-phosphate isomerase-like protein (cupin superfamily)
MRSRYDDIAPYVTKDGSIIRELMHPTVHGNRAQSLAEARVPPGTRTLTHRHLHSEEIYHVTAGEGLMRLGGERFRIGPGDSICIPPGTLHDLESTGREDLVVLCLSAPAYSHEDTELVPEKTVDGSPRRSASRRARAAT